ncbi:MAG: CoB--CoM heterodisulfide reductase iron-sulfur subunit B family protein [Dehalococcoidia bacterium]|nr:CoB--CoM heterodisulfide reductase iron-sulfur subunit B family protein [Dehalococcoidia bacterium]
MKYAYYPGCSQEGGEEHFGKSTEAVCRALGIELEEIHEWTCCGASSGHFLNEDLSLALPAHNLALAEKMGLDTLCVCAACYLRLRHVRHEVRHRPGLGRKIEGWLDMPYEGKHDVRHLLDVVVNEIGLDTVKAKVTKPLKGLRLVCYYGCYLMRPPEIVAFDNPENPTAMDRLAEALGADVRDWSAKVDCCGGSLMLTQPDAVHDLVGNIAERARDVGAEAIVTACPMCTMNLEAMQESKDKLPVVYFTELMGVALGLPDTKKWFKKHLKSPGKVLAAHGL